MVGFVLAKGERIVVEMSAHQANVVDSCAKMARPHALCYDIPHEIGAGVLSHMCI